MTFDSEHGVEILRVNASIYVRPQIDCIVTVTIVEFIQKLRSFVSPFRKLMK